VGSLTEHAQEFGGNKSDIASDHDPGDETDVHHSQQQRRDRETGKFRDGMKRERASRAKATSDDVEAINRWTGELKSAEESVTDIPREAGESDRVYTLRRRAELVKRAQTQASKVARLEQEVRQLRASGASASEIRRAETQVEDAVEQGDPEPDENDARYEGDYTAFVKDHSRWSGREAFRQQYQQAQREQAQQHEFMQTWADRMKAAESRYADFQTVAMGETRIPPNSLLDAYVMEDDNGPDLLYYLNTHPQAVDDILGLPSALAQSKAIAQILLRLSSPSTASSGSTGSDAARRVVKSPPKPPNPVRTEAQRPAESVAADGSLSLLQHYKTFPGRKY
jgi:hypothetical protein